MEFAHRPVMLEEAVEALNIKPGGVYVDCTAGGGGHSFEIASRLTGNARLISIDRDADAVAAAADRLSVFGDIAVVVRRNYGDVGAVLDELSVDAVDGVLWDLGVSSHQLDEAERGFSYAADAPLDMRMDRSSPLSAYDVVNTYSADELCRIIRDYGEEKFAARIAARIVQRRAVSPIRTTGELAAEVAGAIPEKSRRAEHKHPARRTFQAIRIEVNGELDTIEPSLRSAFSHLRSGGRAAVITFHSLEDRIVKNTFADLCRGCVCPPEFPVCVCGRVPEARLLWKKPLTPSECEIAENQRARSAKLRCIEKL